MKRLVFLIYFLLLVFPALSRASSLSDLAASMSPGQWQELTPMTGWNNGVGIIEDPSSSLNTIISFTDKAIWDPVTKKLFILGQSHGTSPPYTALAIYDETTNTWTNSSGTQTFATAHGAGWPFHTYNHLAGPRNGKLYAKNYSNETTVFEYTIATDTWVGGTLPDYPTNLSPSCCNQTDYFPERDSL